MAVVVLAGSVVAAGCATTARVPAGENAAPAGVAVPGRWVSGEYANATGSRAYQLYLPAGYDAKQKHMLVVLLHGCTQDAADIARGTRITEHADREGFIALLPEQPASANAKKCWNWYDPAHQARDAGEPSLIAGMTAKVTADYAVDPDRVHLAGISAGAGMAALVAVAYPETYASVAMHSGIAWRAATSVMAALGVMGGGPSLAVADSLGREAAAAMGARKRAIPALVIQGGSDKVVHPANAAALARQWTRMNANARPTDEPQIALRDDAESNDRSGETNGYHWTRATFGAGQETVDELIVAELGHAWSGGSSTGTFTDEHGPDATAEIVRFFIEHPRIGTR
jgi:poly(hydroxyalkanoate) depolymerase family esterase